MTTTHDLYQDNGYTSRLDYLKSVAEQYHVPLNKVITVAEQLGADEDFDGLISLIEEYYG